MLTSLEKLYSPLYAQYAQQIHIFRQMKKKIHNSYFKLIANNFLLRLTPKNVQNCVAVICGVFL